jgi:hypothetical protein
LEQHHNDPDAFVLNSSIDSSGRSVDWKPMRFPPNDLGVECCALNPDHRYRTDAAIPYRYFTGTKPSVPPSRSEFSEQNPTVAVQFNASVCQFLILPTVVT